MRNSHALGNVPRERKVRYALAVTITESVPTEYAGHLFRSRLEARWCVFFDTAGIAWEYEPHGFAISRGGHLLTRYLPDFWLPDAGQYAEAKGFMPPDNFRRLLDIAHALDHDLVVLGHLPSVWESRWPVQLHRADGPRAALYGLPWSPGAPRLSRAIRESQLTPALLLEGLPVVCPDWAEPALEAARWYRFPHTRGPRDHRSLYR